MRVLIADNQPTVRHALSVWINGQYAWHVVGESGDSSDLLLKMGMLSPEVIILDRDLPGIPTWELVKSLHRFSAEVIIILLFNGAMEQFDADLFDVDYCASKMEPPARIIEAILNARNRPAV